MNEAGDFLLRVSNDKHMRVTHTDDMQNCTYLVRGTRRCANRRGDGLDFCQFHEPNRLAVERAKSQIMNKAESSELSSLMDSSATSVDNSKKRGITRISSNQNRMFNSLATPLVDKGCVGLPASGLSWKTFFHNDQLPVHVDIGCARGRLVLDLALMNHDTNYIGIEVRGLLVDDANLSVESQIKAGKLPGNCRYIMANVLNTNHLNQLEASLNTLNVIKSVSILFPDPWIKKKHKSRRLIQIPVIQSILRLLKPGGVLTVVSDVEDVMNDANDKISSLSDFVPLNKDNMTSIISLSDDHDITITNNKNDAVHNTEESNKNPIESVDKSINVTKSEESVISNIDNQQQDFKFDDSGYALWNPFKPYASEREQVS